MQVINDYLKTKHITLLPYQQRTIEAFEEHAYGLVEAPTGRGKTLAIALSIVQDALKKNKRPKVLWVTPMRALARDTTQQLEEILSYFFKDIALILRTGDASSHQKKKARLNAWDILITTPESCALFTTYSDMNETLQSIETVIIDEWHVLIHQKRGILFELFLSFLTTLNPSHKRWALSATLSSIKDASDCLAPNGPVCHIHDPFKKEIKGDILLPEGADPSCRSLGKHLIHDLIKKIHCVTSCIIFTNTRSQSEQWYLLLKESKQFKANELAIHHSAVDASSRKSAEIGIKQGHIKCIVATSSLDLGVDLEPVDLVVHIGSPKGMARLKQRAGRSGHSPFEAAHILMVPRHGFEVIESVAAIQNLDKTIEDETPYHSTPYDLLMQHITNLGIGRSFSETDCYTMCKSTHTYRNITVEEVRWILDFCCNEHTLLKAYPEHTKLIKTNATFSTNPSKSLQKAQRFNIGAITSDDMLTVMFTNRRPIGTIEEQFIRQLNPSDTFLFAGKILSVKRIQDDAVIVQRATQTLPKYTRWYGGYMSYSSQLSNFMLEQLDNFHNSLDNPYELAQQFLKWQHQDSMVPKNDECLIEITSIDQCPTVFIYPFCGRAANHALAMSLSHKMAEYFKCASAMTVNDYGIMIQFDKDIDSQTFDFKTHLCYSSIEKSSESSFNQNEMVLQEFRHICLTSGLIYRGLPGRLKTGRYTQSSVRILYDIFKEYDPDNLLLKQAQQTVFHTQIFPSRLQKRLSVISEKCVIKSIEKISPFGYTLYQEQLSAKMDGK